MSNPYIILYDPLYQIKKNDRDFLPYQEDEYPV